MTTRTILWADDQIEELRSQILFLQGKGFEVVGASNGEDAISLVRDRRFDAVLLDEMMPGKGGMETLQSIRGVDPFVPVIMITKSQEEELMDRALGRRVTDYLVKPVQPTQILMALKRALDEESIRRKQMTQDYLRGFAELARQRVEARTPADWSSIYEAMVTWELELTRLSDPALWDAHREQLRDANAQFCRFVERHYRDWVQGREAPVLSHQVVERWVAPHLKSGQRVFLIVMDCMRLDQWRALEPLLDPLFTMQRENYFSILPSATPFARNAIFAGLLPIEIAKRFPQHWRGAANEERSKNASEREFLTAQLTRLGLKDTKLKYYKTFNAGETEAMRRQIPTLRDVHLVVGVVNFLDILAHGRSHNELLRELAPDEAAFRAVMRSWFEHSSLMDMFRDVAQMRDAVVVVTTDHGSVQVRKSSLVKANREASTNLRYKYGDNLAVDPSEAFVMKNPREFGLPSDSPIQNYICAKEYGYFVYPTNFHEYERQYRGSFQHGGLSLEELIIPCATLRPR